MPDTSSPSSEYQQAAALFDAIKKGVDTTALQLQAGNRYINAQCFDESKSTLLHRAVQRDNLTLVRHLLEMGADPNIKNKYGHASAEFAISSNSNRSILSQLLYAGHDLKAIPLDCSRKPKAQKMIARHKKDCNQRWLQWCAKESPDVTQLDAQALKRFASIGRYDEVMQLPQWQDHPEHLLHLTQQLPLHLVERIAPTLACAFTKLTPAHTIIPNTIDISTLSPQASRFVVC